MKKYKFNEFIILHDKKRIPLSSIERKKRQGKYRYYGAQGVIDHINDYIFDGKFVLLAEDGENLKSKKQNIAQYVTGKFWVNNHAHIITTTDICRLKYFYYLINTIDVSEYITGSAQPKLSQISMNKMEFEIPEIKVQDKILSILNAIDKKITLNNEINKNLLQQAQALYNHSFPYTVSDILPEGWRLGTVSEIIEIHDSKRIPLSGAQRDKMKKKIYPYYGAASLMDYVDEYIFDGKYLLLGEDGTVVDDAGFPILQYVWGQFWVNNHAHILTGKLGYNVESLYMLFKQTPVRSIVTGAVQPKISQVNLKSIPVVIPPTNLIRAFNNQVNEMFALIRNIEVENKSLSTLRDSLLPKLMSGEIDLSVLDL